MAFTDIEGSTRLLQRVGDRWAGILGAHHGIVRSALGDHNGYEVDTAGDGFFVSFARATDAVGFAVDLQRRLAADPVLGPDEVKVRIGLHTGEVEVSGGDYLGLAVHHAARIAAAAHGGQVLVSDATKTMASVRDDIDYLDLGEHELKDLARPVRLYQLTGADLAREFPPVRALNSRVDRLPVTRSTFVGREDDVVALRALLASPGLVTLTGPGGCGKTRLAIEVAREALDVMPGGAWFVDLRAAAGGAQVEEKLVAVLSVENVDAVAAKFRGDAAAIVLDNCEHLIDACADLVERLLDACPELRVIATSRELLGIHTEVARRVPPLGSPSAVELFGDRAGRVDAGFVVDEHNNATVARICARLDGIPLAIELAAARVRHMSVEALEDRLDDMFRVLVGSDRRPLQRHQTLEAVIDWSYQLLEPDERAVLRRLAVFAGGFDLAAADVVCEVDGTTDIVFRLVDGSLVERDIGDRYHLLETIRAFGQVRLRDDGESDDVRHRHLEHFVAMADRLGPRLLGPEFFDVVDDLEVDVDNIRDAMEWALGSRNVERAVGLLGELAPFFSQCGHGAIITTLGEEALAAAEAAGVPAAARARALALAGFAGLSPGYNASIVHAAEAVALYEAIDEEDRDEFYGWALASHAFEAAFMGDADEAAARGPAALAECDARGWAGPASLAQAANAFAKLRHDDLPGAREEMARAVGRSRDAGGGLMLIATLFWSGLLSIHAKDWAVGRAFYEEAMPMARRLPYKLWLQWMLDHLAATAMGLDDFVAARSYCEEGLAESRAAGLVGLGNYPSLLANLADLERRLGQFDQAAMYMQEATDLARSAHFENDDRRRIGLVPMLAGLADLHLLLDEIDAARSALREAVEALDGLDPVEIESMIVVQAPVGSVLESLSRLSKREDRPVDALELLAAAAAWRSELRQPLSSERAQAVAAQVAALRAELGDEAFDSAWARGEQETDRLGRARRSLLDP